MCDWLCPNCGSDYHSGCDVGMTTTMYFKPIYKGGVNQNPDRNTFTCTIHCHECGRNYRVESIGGEQVSSKELPRRT